MKDKTFSLLYFGYIIGFFLILALPLLVFPPWFTPIGWGKVIVFRIIFAILLFIFISQIFLQKIDKNYLKEKIQAVLPLLIILFALLGISFLSTIFSPTPKISFWGEPLRSGGFVNFAFYILLAILLFLIVKGEDWQKIWDFSIIIGIIVSIITVIQQFSLFSKFFIPFTFRPVGTIGNPIPLALYLLLLTFISFSFFQRSDIFWRKFFYFTSFLLFILVSFLLVQTRGALLGLMAGFIWFSLFYPRQKRIIQIAIVVAILLAIWGIFYLNSNFYLLEKQPYVIKSAIGRILSFAELSQTSAVKSRLSTWKVSWEALKEKPILGYGAENFKIAFDKHYDASLPGIGLRKTEKDMEVEWWDRAHNFLFDIAINYGIFALIIYPLLFFFLIWKLQQVKKQEKENYLISHGVQATFVAYLVANLSSIETFDNYLLVFLFVGYSLYLISGKSESVLTTPKEKEEKIPETFLKYQVPLISILFFLLIWFLFVFNLKPLALTKDLNLARDYGRINKCAVALELVDKITSDKKNIVDNFLALESIDVVQSCIIRNPEHKEKLLRKAVQILEENAKRNPQYTLNWMLAGGYVGLLLQEKKIVQENILPQEEEELRNKAEIYFQEASLLSPRRASIYQEWAKSEMSAKDYEKAKEKIQKCIDFDPDYGGCYWTMALIQGYLGNQEQFKHFEQIAKDYDYDLNSPEALQELTNLYIAVGNYQGLVNTYSQLISLTQTPKEKAQLLASLAAVYKDLGNIEKAKKTALEILEIFPQGKADVEFFLKTLR
jgi:O-antigen ligase